MPFGYECRTRILKQLPTQPTVRTQPISQETASPGPNEYEHPEICGGNGYSKIKRAPAYTFGRVLKSYFSPAVKLNAPMLDVSGRNSKLGQNKIPGGLITAPNWPPDSKLKIPGPGAHEPLLKTKVKRSPAYSLQHAAKPPYQPYDMWTPPPNMYWPPIQEKKAPAYTFPYLRQISNPFNPPGPGTHEPKYVQRKTPAYSFAPGHRSYVGALKTPAPNTYCEKKFMVGKPSTPAPSFGIKHSPYLGKPGVYTKPSDLELQISRI